MVTLARSPVNVALPGPHCMLLVTNEVPVFVDWSWMVWVPEPVNVQSELTLPLLTRLAV